MSCVSFPQRYGILSADGVARALSKYMKLNYLFTLNEEYIVDGARAGNETRYINHGNDKLDQTNCVARSEYPSSCFRPCATLWLRPFGGEDKLVNGDCHIGIFACTF